MIDLHCHILPGIDDGAADLGVALDMARRSVADGVSYLACTPHIFPGVYNNSGPDIRRRVAALQTEIDREGIPLRLVTGGDVHVAPDLVARLRSGDALSLNDTRYVLVEPPHHILPPNLESLFFNLLSAGYLPIVTHPERMTWIDREYDLLQRLALSGAWMQITAGAIVGKFGSRAKHWSERLLRDGLVHIVASDAHDVERRPPLMAAAFRELRDLVGEDEARNLVLARPAAILQNAAPNQVVAPQPRRRASGRAEPETFWGKVAEYFRVG
jgi:protein-tyrosine phosphatase